MTLTRDFEETVAARTAKDPEFANALFEEAIELMLSGDADVGKSLLRDDINATIGLKPLAKAVGIPDKSLMRMFSDKGNPTFSNLFSVTAYLQEQNKVNLEVHAT